MSNSNQKGQKVKLRQHICLVTSGYKYIHPPPPPPPPHTIKPITHFNHKNSTVPTMEQLSELLTQQITLLNVH